MMEYGIEGKTFFVTLRGALLVPKKLPGRSGMVLPYRR